MAMNHYCTRHMQRLYMVAILIGLSQPAYTDNMRLVELKAEEVRQLRESGDIMPLEDLLRKIRADHPGRVIEIELEQEHDRYVYELEVVDDEGVVWELYFDAYNG